MSLLQGSIKVLLAVQAHPLQRPPSLLDAQIFCTFSHEFCGWKWLYPTTFEQHGWTDMDEIPKCSTLRGSAPFQWNLLTGWIRSMNPKFWGLYTTNILRCIIYCMSKSRDLTTQHLLLVLKHLELFETKLLMPPINLINSSDSSWPASGGQRDTKASAFWALRQLRENCASNRQLHRPTDAWNAAGWIRSSRWDQLCSCAQTGDKQHKTC